jgi:hypothetical protein
MNRINTIFRLIHLCTWVLLSLLVALQLWSEGHPYWLTLSTAFLLTCLYIFYGHFYLLTRYFAKKKKSVYFLRLLGILLTGPFPYLFFHYTAPNFLDYYSLNLISTVPIFIFLSWLARVTETLVINTIKKEQLEKQAVEAELYYLKSQINPHFLFNTLNNIHTLVYKQSPAASKAVVSLSSLMRYMIHESNAPTAPLSREIDYLQDYISLQQLRYKNSPVVELTLEGDTASGHIAPLLFIHLLENAYKHSPAWLEPGAIKVKVALKNNTLTLSIQNPIAKKPGDALGEFSGIGLPNVRKRLALLYPDQHSLEINSIDGLFTVILEIHSLHLSAHEREAHLLYH